MLCEGVSDRGTSTANPTPATCEGSVGATCGFRTRLSKFCLKNGARRDAEPKMPALPPLRCDCCHDEKNQQQQINPPKECGPFCKEMIATFWRRKLLTCMLLCCLVFLNSPFHTRNESLSLHNAGRFRAHFGISRILIFFGGLWIIALEFLHSEQF